MKLFPQFSIRVLFLLTFAAAILSWVGAQAVAGALWAIAMMLACAFGVALLLLHAALFLIAWPLSQYTQQWFSRGKSPFLENPVLPSD